MSITYAGTTLAVVNAEPTTNTATDFALLTWVPGTCALRSVPAIMREWVKVTEDLVCATTNTDKKGSSKWIPVLFTLSNLVGDADAAQAIYQSLEASRTAMRSFRITLPGTGGILYFTAMVSKFSLADGGGQDAYHTSTVELLIQATPVHDIT